MSWPITRAWISLLASDAVLIRRPVVDTSYGRTGPGASTIHRMQARKLGLKPGQRVSLDDPPPGWTLSDPPDGLEYVGRTR